MTHPLRAWRAPRKIRLTTLADKVGTSASHLSEIENGNRTPSLEMAGRLWRATMQMDIDGEGVPLEALLKAEAE